MDGRGCEWMEGTYRPLFLSLLNLPPTTTMENKQVKRSLEQSFDSEAKRARGDRVGQLEHCMMNFYREDHEKQMDLKEAWRKRSEVLEERATRLHRHGLQMANTIETQEERIAGLTQRVEDIESQRFNKGIQHYHLQRSIRNVINGVDDDGNQFYDMTGIQNYLRYILECHPIQQQDPIDDDSTISDYDITEQEQQEVIDLTASDDEGYESDTEGLGLNNLDIQWPRGNI